MGLRYSLTEARARGLIPPKEQKPKSRFRSTWEARYADKLTQQQRNGEILDWGYERVHLMLPGGIAYRLDFDIFMPDGTIQIHEVKGRMREPGRIKLRQAIELYPGFKWHIVKGDLTPVHLANPSDVPSTTR